MEPTDSEPEPGIAIPEEMQDLGLSGLKTVFACKSRQQKNSI